MQQAGVRRHVAGLMAEQRSRFYTGQPAPTVAQLHAFSRTVGPQFQQLMQFSAAAPTLSTAPVANQLPPSVAKALSQMPRSDAVDGLSAATFSSSLPTGPSQKRICSLIPNGLIPNAVTTPTELRVPTQQSVSPTGMVGSVEPRLITAAQAVLASKERDAVAAHLASQEDMQKLQAEMKNEIRDLEAAMKILDSKMAQPDC